MGETKGAYRAKAALGGVRYDYVEVLSKVSMAFVVFAVLGCLGGVPHQMCVTSRRDREHPTVRTWPIAAGVVPGGLAYTVAVVLERHQLAGAWMLTPNLALVRSPTSPVAGVLLGLKHQAVVEICVVSMAYFDPRHRLGAWPPRSRCPSGFADRGIRFAFMVAGKRQRRAASGRTHRRCDPQVAGKPPAPICGLSDVVGHRWSVLRAVG